jgi:hypothetical protein
METLLTFNVSPLFLAASIGSLTSLALNYAPKLAYWYDKRTSAEKRWIYALVVLLLVGVSYAGDCYGVFETNLVCTPKGGLEAFGLVLTALGIGNGVHNQTKPSPETKEKLGIA